VERVVLRGTLNQFGTTAWSKGVQVLLRDLNAYCAQRSASGGRSKADDIEERVRSCICRHRVLIVSRLRKVSLRSKKYDVTRAVEELMQEISCTETAPLPTAA
jgi:hypothetical protein